MIYFEIKRVSLLQYNTVLITTGVPLSFSPLHMMVRAALVTATSLVLTAAVVAHAYVLKHQFYPTVVYLTKSSPSMAVSPTSLSKLK